MTVSAIQITCDGCENTWQASDTVATVEQARQELAKYGFVTRELDWYGTFDFCEVCAKHIKAGRFSKVPNLAMPSTATSRDDWDHRKAIRHLLSGGA